jgi:hypothetical protein
MLQQDTEFPCLLYVLITCYGCQSDVFCNIPKYDGRGTVKGEERGQAFLMIPCEALIVRKPTYLSRRHSNLSGGEASN